MGIFRHLPDDIIEINGEKFDLELFLELEPEYYLPENTISREYESGSHHILYSKDNQFQGEFPWINGDRYILRVADLNLLLNTIEEDNKYVRSLQKENSEIIKDRQTEYPRTDELIVAMWEYFVEGRPAETTINIVQEKRLKVKEQFPNEDNL
jgi:hypothetical protein